MYPWRGRIPGTRERQTHPKPENPKVQIPGMGASLARVTLARMSAKPTLNPKTLKLSLIHI